MQVTVFGQDLLDLKPFAERLERYINVEHQFVEGSLVIALSSKFGSGKTTFLQMWKADIESRGEEVDIPLVISLNAWESDYYGDPLFAAVSGIVDRIQESGKSAESIVDAAKDVGWFATAIGDQIVRKVSGINIVAAGTLAEKKKAERNDAREIPQETFTIYRGRKDAMDRLKNEIQNFVVSGERRVFFFVDELDRCRPDYAIKYLETIKHVFDVEGAVFLLAADREQLENSAKTAFGRDLDFEEYYRKFVHREVTLPAISDSGYMKLAKAYVNYYLERDDLRRCYMDLGSAEENIRQLIGGLRLTPRQIQETFRILGHLCETSKENKRRLMWSFAASSIAMAAFKVGRPEVFHLLGTQQFAPEHAATFLKEVLPEDKTWWFLLFLTGGGLDVTEAVTPEVVMREVGLLGEEEELESRQYMAGWGKGWGHKPGAQIREVYQRIEQLVQWAH